MKALKHPEREWLKHKISVEYAEAAMRSEVSKLGVGISPDWLARWDDFKAQLQQGDEVWYFEHFPKSMTGVAGYCIIRGAEIIASITTVRA